MRITCPECGYSREIADDKIPEKSVRATCPKCGAKFRFREAEPEFKLEPMEGPEAERPAPEPADEARPDHAPETARESLESSEADNEDTLHEGPGEAGRIEDEPEPGRIPGSDDEQGLSDEDIWQRLENMGSGADGQDSDEGGGEGFKDREYGSEKTSPQAEVPWERLDIYGFFGGVSQTVKRAMLAPSLFFSAMPIGRGLSMPLVFFLLVSEFQAICQLAWSYLGVGTMMTMGGHAPGTEPATAAFGAGSLFILLLYPVLFTIWLFVMSGVMHALLKLFGSGAAGFEGTFRVLSYAAAPSVLAIIPYAGTVVGGFWSLVIMFIGLKSIHSTTFIRVLFAFLLPMVIVMALAISLVSMQSGSMPKLY